MKYKVRKTCKAEDDSLVLIHGLITSELSRGKVAFGVATGDIQHDDDRISWSETSVAEDRMPVIPRSFVMADLEPDEIKLPDEVKQLPSPSPTLLFIRVTLESPLGAGDECMMTSAGLHTYRSAHVPREGELFWVNGGSRYRVMSVMWNGHTSENKKESPVDVYLTVSKII